MRDTYDVIIIGAGSAGCVLANRLSADPARSVLLLEAGSWDWNPLISIPLGARKMTQWGLHEWGDVSEPDAMLDGRRHRVIHGRVIGGTSSLNYMAHTRGHPADYDGWAAGGATGWSYAEVLPHFKAVERWSGGEDEWRGGAGELGASPAVLNDPIHEAWSAAAAACGIDASEDTNGRRGEGIAPLQFSVLDGRRSSTARAFLKAARRRPNLTVLTRCHATRIVFDGRRAVGVQYRRAGRSSIARARDRVVASLGAINSPQLLMLSGVGPADHLRAMGVPIVADLPVGRNLEDHLGFGLTWARREPGPFHRQLRLDRIGMSMIRAYLRGTGHASSPPCTLSAFVRSRQDLSQPDIELLFSVVPGHADLWLSPFRRPYEDAFAIRMYLLSQKSRGEILLRSSDPMDRPRIIYNSLTAPGDLETMREAFRRMWRIGSCSQLAGYAARATLPERALATDEEIDAFIRREAAPQYHPAGTCRMGAGRDCVVDPNLDVHGLDGLSVVDASIMPRLVSANPNVPIAMIAAKAAWQWTDGA